MKLLAPNGKPSNLTPEQYRLVRTPAFKKWFGDWERSPKSASKVVDENGEPLVVWHYSNKTFNKFKTPTFFAEIKNSYKTKILKNEYGVFLSIKNPLELRYKKLGKTKFFNVVRKIFESVKFKDGEALIDEDIEFYMYNAYQIKDSQGFYKLLTDFIGGYNWDWAFDYAKNKGYEGLIYNETDRELTTTFNGYAVFEPSQIKLADGTNTTFDSSNPDIRFNDGGGVNSVEKVEESIKRFLNNQVLIDDEPIRSYGDMKIGDIINVINEYVDLPDSQATRIMNLAPNGQPSNSIEKTSYGFYSKEFGRFEVILNENSAIIFLNKKSNGEKDAFLYLENIDNKGYIELDFIAIDNENFRRKGLGTLLFYLALTTGIEENHFKGIKSLYNSSFSDNPRSKDAERMWDILSSNTKFYVNKKGFDYYIKLADGSNTTFDGSNPDIRFKTGGSIRKPKKRTISQTPAPKKDRIYGSKINKPKSSESKSKASSIILSPSVIKSIRTKINQHNEEYPNKKIPLSSAKAVVRRGMGAYSSTHRPTISGGKPNSRVAWGLARLNAFIYKIVKGKSKSGKYKQDDDLINELGYRVKSYAYGGQITDEQKETYKKWKELVNMSRSELEKFYNSQEGKVAGLSPSEAKKAGIDSGRESARWIMKMKYVPVKEWNSNMWRWAKKQISFISRMSGVKGKLYDEKGRKTRKHLALLIWGHNPEKQ